MFWFDPQHPDVLFGDIRDESHVLCDGRTLSIEPDMELDFRDMPFPDGSFKLVVFDPPHLRKAGPQSWMGKKYGVLNDDWRADLKAGFAECFRVLATDGVLIFKWNEVQIKTGEILKLTDRRPLFGHKSGKRSDTHWMCFMKRPDTTEGGTKPVASAARPNETKQSTEGPSLLPGDPGQDEQGERQ